MALSDLVILVVVWAVLMFFLGVRAWPAARGHRTPADPGGSQGIPSPAHDHLEPAA